MRSNPKKGVVFASLTLPEGLHHRWATIAECERMLARGECTKVIQPGKRSIGKTRPVYRLVARPEPSKSSVSPAPITFEDILANVGLDARPHRERVDRKVIKATRLKIANYRGVFQHDPSYQSA